MKRYQRLARYLRPYTLQLFLAVVCMGGVAGLNALRIYLVKPLQDRVFLVHDWGMLHHLMWWVPTISIVLGGLSYAQNYLMESIGQRSIADLREEMFDHVQTMSMDFFAATSSGK